MLLPFFGVTGSAAMAESNPLYKKPMIDQILYFKCERCNHEGILSDALRKNILTIIPGKSIQPGRVNLNQIRHRFKCSECSNIDIELVLGKEKNEGVNSIPDPREEVYCGSCGGDIEEGRLRIVPDTNVCAACARSVINLLAEEGSDLAPESCRLCNALMVLILPQSEH